MSRRVRVLIADDQPLLRAGFKSPQAPKASTSARSTPTPP
jgi:hypothetical protein